MKPISVDSPLIIAWKKYKGTTSYSHNLEWLKRRGDDEDNLLWVLFVDGFIAGMNDHRRNKEEVPPDAT